MGRLLGAAALLVGAAGLAAFGVFLWGGTPGRLAAGWLAKWGFAPGWAPAAALAWDAGLSLLFFAQHSGLVRRGTRRALRRFVPQALDGACYSLTSGAVLLLVVFLWQPVDVTVVALTGPARWAARALFVGAGLAMVWGAVALRAFDPFGLAPLRPGGAPPPRFSVRGPYRWVRHPLYALSLVLIWAQPDVSLDRLGFALLWSAWILIAWRWEERDLLARFGNDYRAYCDAVPALVPRPWRRAHPRA